MNYGTPCDLCLKKREKMTIDKNKYLAPTLRSVVLGAGALLCVSEKYNLPQGIGIATYDTITGSEDNDW